MAVDISILLDSETFEGDITYQAGDLVREKGLSTAVLISLLTDRRASTDDVIDDPTDKKGWWGDLVPDVGDRIGSKLWQHERSKTTNADQIKIRKAMEESLQWMIDDGVAKKIIITTERFGVAGNYRLGATIKIYKTFGGEEVIKFDDLWEAQLAI